MTSSAAFYQLAARVETINNAAELGFVICNETRLLVEYRQAALLSLTPSNRARLIAHSGLSDTDNNTPYALWLAEVARDISSHCRTLPATARVLALTPELLKETLASQWNEWFPPHVWVLPLTGADGEIRALWFIGRDTPWPSTLAPTSAEFSLLQLAGLYGYAWWALNARPSRFMRLWQQNTGRRLGIITLCCLLILCIPVREYTLVPVEIISLKSEVIAAPDTGVIKRINVLPNSDVVKGQVLAILDDITLRNRLAVAEAELQTADTTLHQASQQAIEDQQAKVDLAMAEGKWREKQVEVESLKRDLDKLTIRAPGNGVFVYSDPDDWAGRPVQTGERIGLLADPTELGVRAWAPVSESTNLSRGAPMTIFLKVAPLESLSARLDYAGYQTVEAPNGVASYLLRGTLQGKPEVARIGLQGTARVTGNWSILGYLLLRRPVATLRAWGGW
ncbi:HlyD family efflux transporter periplasmic adaptor subunit [Buttiauxella selenatireducens]|uniref:HlyD family efflux transporter periplasmic adaptor subunit n=1 Tax=Buttiauxella selenatireducens TaxID=3073902 RepID=A0ABY9S4Z8_9ENTR|nr:HlyD family efflux transporter periplasmic adaptor subunit [Buttiauxella sp. R73]WMY72588.1 HlyD family efflux transporter periplasmic adaptor subunit [Buttiauxella sp. R73]